MKLCSVNCNANTSYQNTPQNFGSIKISLLNAHKLKFARVKECPEIYPGERYLPRSVRGILDKITKTKDISASEKAKANELLAVMGKNDVILTTKEMSTYSDTKYWEKQGVYDQGQALETLNYFIEHAKDFGTYFAVLLQKIAKNKKGSEIEPSKAGALFKKFGDELKQYRTEIFKSIEDTTQLPPAPTPKPTHIEEFGPTGTIMSPGGPFPGVNGPCGYAQ